MIAAVVQVSKQPTYRFQHSSLSSSILIFHVLFILSLFHSLFHFIHYLLSLLLLAYSLIPVKRNQEANESKGIEKRSGSEDK